jgi:hypothetical protein
VIDKGRAAGLRDGDAIGADGIVLHAGASYAVVRPALGRYREGDLLARTLVAPADVLALPSVLVSVRKAMLQPTSPVCWRTRSLPAEPLRRCQ